ncbi:oligosaccharide flippase family protein [Paenibacillus castaneae]|uniref:oligosaccharide flippase family protein n=1 Tax=Paenibacillus castaneae TaxID=474957 RepID=UPI001ABAFB01|nr:oligosaccharide flippase family protein [Paenibacillus castaneae]
MNNQTTTSRLLKGLSWNVVGIIGQKSFTMISSILVARMLGATVFGEYGIINGTVSMFATFAGLALGMTSTKIIAEYKTNDKNKVERVLGLTNLFAVLSGIIMMVLVYLLADWLAINHLNNKSIAIYLKIAAIGLLFNTFNGVQRGSLSGFEKFSHIAKVDVLMGISSCFLTLYFTYYYGLIGLVTVGIAISVINNIVCTYLIRRTLKQNNMKINYKEFYKEINIFWYFSLPSMLSSIMVGPVTWFANTVFVKIPNGYTELGIYNAANQWKTLLMLLPQTFSMVMLPILVSAKNKNDINLDKINMWFSWIIVIVLSIPLVNIPDVISYLYGSEYISQSYNTTLVIVALTTLLISYNSGIGRVLMTNNLVWLSFLSNLFWGIVLIVSSYILRDLGSIGFALAFLTAYVINTIVFFPIYIIKKIIPKSFVFSKEIVLLWGVIIGEALVTITEMNLFIRLGIVAVNILVVLGFVYKYFIKKLKG